MFGNSLLAHIQQRKPELPATGAPSSLSRERERGIIIDILKLQDGYPIVEFPPQKCIALSSHHYHHHPFFFARAASYHSSNLPYQPRTALPLGRNKVCALSTTRTFSYQHYLAITHSKRGNVYQEKCKNMRICSQLKSYMINI